MPFDEEDEEDDEDVSSKSKKSGLKQVSTQKSIFESIPKKSTPENLEKRVQQIQEKDSNYKTRASELAIQFKKAMEDKTLASNKSIFAQDLEKNLLSQMIELAVEINNDQEEQYEGMGSLSWITLLLKTCFAQRDKINKLDYNIFEISKALDNKKKSE